MMGHKGEARGPWSDRMGGCDRDMGTVPVMRPGCGRDGVRVGGRSQTVRWVMVVVIMILVVVVVLSMATIMVMTVALKTIS